MNGARLLYEFCAQHNIPHRRSGKLIVAHDEHEVQALEALLARATDNGVQGMEIVEQAFIREREPHLKVRVALFSPNTGMLNAEALVQTLARLCREKDAFLLPGSPLVGADADCGWRRTANAGGVDHGSLGGQCRRTLRRRSVRRCWVARTFQIYPCRGEYAELVPAKRDLVNGLVYPLPHTHGLGVHMTKTIAGNVTLGPTVKYQDRKDDYEDDRIPLERFSRTGAAAAPGDHDRGSETRRQRHPGKAPPS